MGEADKHGLPGAEWGILVMAQDPQNAAKIQNGKPELRAPASHALATW
jgi:hypothetical protein